jgi:glycosyltransferase involved in cell wall biosynthesis
MTTPLRCLLISAVAPPDPANGDAQYTEDLLADPPEGIAYVTYTDALAAGELEWGPSVRTLATWRSPSALPAAFLRGGVGAARRLGLLLPDPVRWVKIQGRFDLVHVHCMPVRFLGSRPPLVISDSAGTFWHWTLGHGVPAKQVWRLLRRERATARLLGYVHPTANPAADGLVYFIPSGMRIVAELGVDASHGTVCPPGVPATTQPRRGDGRTLLFVGRDFEYKGGPDALEILRRVRAELPDARLLVAGPSDPVTDEPGVEWLGLLPREQLYAEVYPRADVFVYPTRVDCAPLVVQEALANGVPVVAPRILGLPDLVRDGETGHLFEAGDLGAAAAAVVALLRDSAALTQMQEAAHADFERRFSATHRNEVLGAVYRAAIA